MFIVILSFAFLPKTFLADIFFIFGHTNVQTLLWNFDHPKSMLKTDHFGGSKNGKKKSFGLEKSHEKIFFAQTFFKLLRALKGFIFDFFRLFVSVLGPKVEKMLVFCSKINEISNRSKHVAMSKNRKNLIFEWAHSEVSFWAGEQALTIRKMFRYRGKARRSIFGKDRLFFTVGLTKDLKKYPGKIDLYLETRFLGKKWKPSAKSL